MAKILVIDDEKSIRDLLGTLLSRKGHAVVLAAHGAQALDLYRRESPQVVLLDLFMPGMDGIAVLEQLRALDRTVPVVILTGMGSTASETRAKELGVTAFLEKGFSLHLLGEAMAKALESVHSPSPGGGVS